jgi:hypothetical protein
MGLTTLLCLRRVHYFAVLSLPLNGAYMTSIIRAAFVSVVALVCVSTSGPQTPEIHKVLILAEGPDAEPIASALRSKIGGTLRYQLSEDDGDLWIDIECVKTQVSGRVTGNTCAATYSYHPKALAATSLYLTTQLGVGPPNDTSIAEGMFEALVSETSDEQLAKKKTEAILHIHFACRDHLGMNDEVAQACTGR